MSKEDLFYNGQASEELIAKNDEYVMAENEMSPEAQKEYEEWLKSQGANNE